MLSDAQRAALAARLRQGRRVAEPAVRGPIVPLGTAGAVSAFAVHAVGGSVHEYAPLARALDGACRLNGIEAAGLRAGTAPVDSLDTMATRYADAVRGAQPDGPYHLIGWSMGGVLAFETARRIEAAGGEVGVVALIDAPYRLVPSFADSEEGLAALFVADALRGAGHSPDTSAALPVPEQLARLAERLVADPAERLAMVPDLERRYAVFAAHTTALAGYLPAGPVASAGVLVSAHGSRDSATGWTAMFRGATHTATTAADHYGCLRAPAVTVVADAVRAALGPALR